MSADPKNSRKVMVVSPNDLSEELGPTVFCRRGIDHKVVNDITTAFDKVKTFRPNLVLIEGADQEPIHSLVTTLRDCETTKGTAIVIIYHALSPDTERAFIAAGANLIIPLPLNMELWGDHLEQLLRVQPRCETRMPVRAALWTQEITADSIEFQGIALNISCGGMLIEADRLLLVGSKLDVKFRLPGQTEELGIVVQVIWSAKAEKQYRSGIQILVMRKNSRQCILEYVSAAIAEEKPSFPAAGPGFEKVDEKDEWERELRISEARKMAIIDASMNAIITTDSLGFIIEFNTAAELLFGYKRSHILGKNILDTLVPPSLRDSLHQEYRRLVSDGKRLFGTLQFETSALHLNEEEFPIEVVLRPVMVKRRLLLTAFVRDLTELKTIDKERLRLESQLRQSQKLEAIGTLASGIAHEFNNMLSAIVGYSELTLSELTKDSMSYMNIREILNVTDRAKNVVRQVLTFSRKDKVEQQHVRIDKAVIETFELINKTFPSTIEVRRDINEQTGTVFADPTQLHQIVLNLCTNALHALQSGGGVLSIFLEPVVIDTTFKTSQAGLTTGHYALLAVKDTGQGMDPSTLSRIFEPFFTTKTVGEGTGLGLAVVYGIVQSLGGEIFAESKPGKGTTFRVYIPLSHGKEAEKVGELDQRSSVSKRILFVDDDPGLALLGESTLRALGHTVTSVTSSEGALEIVRKDSDSFDLIITDQIMPGLTGLELTSKVKAIKPEMPVILCTGFSEFDDKQETVEHQISAIVMKPFRRAEIAETIDRIMKDHEG